LFAENRRDRDPLQAPQGLEPHGSDAKGIDLDVYPQEDFKSLQETSFSVSKNGEPPPFPTVLTSTEQVDIIKCPVWIAAGRDAPITGIEYASHIINMPLNKQLKPEG